MLRLALVVGAVALAAPAADAAVAQYWPVAKVMRAIDGAAVHVGARTVRVDTETALCSGSGAAIRVRGVRRWRAFLCTQTTFTKRGVDRDLEFRVRILDARRFRITDAQWVPDAR